MMDYAFFKGEIITKKGILSSNNLLKNHWVRKVLFFMQALSYGANSSLL
jgi:hypothetical protein